MALSRLETWYTQANADFPSVSSITNVSKSFAWLLKEMLTSTALGSNGSEGAPPAGSLWTVLGSSDGVTAAIDGTDRLSPGTFNAAKYVVANEGSAHSWIYLKSPNALGPLYMVINGPLSTTDVAFTYSTSAFTGGSTTARPTSTVQWTVAYNGTGSSTVTTAGAVAQKFHLTRNAAGSWYCITNAPGSGIFTTITYAVKLADARATDQCPYATLANTHASTLGNTGTCFAAGGCGQYSQKQDLTAQVLNQAGGFFNGFQGNSSDAGTANTSNYDGTLDANPIVVSIFSSAGAINGVKGRLPDCYCLCQRVSPASMVPSSSPYLFTAVGGFLLPFSVVPSI